MNESGHDMRFPLSLTRSMAGYLLGKRLSGQKRFPMVLMLEPLHACNLKCVGCGRIREYSDTVSQRLSVEEFDMELNELLEDRRAGQSSSANSGDQSELFAGRPVFY